MKLLLPIIGITHSIISISLRPVTPHFKMVRKVEVTRGNRSINVNYTSVTPKVTSALLPK